MKVKGLTILSLIFATALKVKAALTQEEKDTLLNLHREARAAVNASNMKEINWDNNLATIAQNYASTCPGMVHSDSGPENIAAGSSGTVTDLFNQFMKEKADFDKSNARQKFMDGSYGHYSQIVWADNTKVGCGLENCSEKNGLDFEMFMVCRYEEGNIIDYEVYALNTTTTTTITTTITSTVTTTSTTTSTSTSTSTSTTTVTTSPTSSTSTTAVSPEVTTSTSTTVASPVVTTTTSATSNTATTTTTIAEPIITTSTNSTITSNTVSTTTTSSTIAAPVTTTTTTTSSINKTKTTSTTISTPIKTPDPNLPTGSINKCGEGVAICARGYCCSEYGFCGTSELHCGKGCQLGYGSCDSDPTNPPNKNPPTYDNNNQTNDDDDNLPSNSSGKRSANHVICVKGFCINKTGFWFLSSLFSYALLNVIFGL